MSRKPQRRRNAGLVQPFRQPRIVIPEPQRKLWPASNPDDAVIWWRTRLEKPLFVYFIQDAHGPIKIGKAYDPRARLTELQCGNPEPLALRAVVLAAADTETKLHAAWKGYCVHGEWFGADRALHILELAKRTQRQQIDAFKRGKSQFDVQAMPADAVRPIVKVRANLLVSL